MAAALPIFQLAALSISVGSSISAANDAKNKLNTPVPDLKPLVDPNAAEKARDAAMSKAAQEENSKVRGRASTLLSGAGGVDGSGTSLASRTLIGK